MAEKIEDRIQQVIQEALPASCTIYVRDRKQSWSGSGFHIGNGLVVTAGHVTPRMGLEINITFDGKILYPCTVLVTDEPNLDAAVLRINSDASSIPFVVLGNSENIQKGDTVAVIGAPEGWHDSITVGRVSNFHQSMGPDAPSKAWTDNIFIDADILEGNSGGMCINTSGLVIGSVMGVAGINANIGIGMNVLCPSNKIINLIKNRKIR
jgi:serine protease Do